MQFVHLDCHSILPLVFLLPAPIFSRECGPRFEVTCPSLAILVQTDKNKALIYELDITNFDTVPLRVKHIEIFANRESSEPMITLENEKLSAAMIRVGAEMMMSSGSATLYPGLLRALVLARGQATGLRTICGMKSSVFR